MAYTAKYITLATDITDSLARDFVSGSDSRLLTWHENAELELEALALEKGVLATQIVTPIMYRLKEYCVAYFCFLLFQDTVDENQVENTDDESYQQKLKWYYERCRELRSQITKEMFLYTAQSLTPQNMVNVGVIWRA